MTRHCCMTRHRFTIIELLAVSALLLIVLTGVVRIFYDASLANRQFTDSAFRNQQVMMLQRDWQQAVRGTDPAAWQINEYAFEAPNAYVYVEDGKLVFEHGERQIARKLPPDAAVTFAAEGPDAAPYAVLNLAWISRHRHRDTAEQVRLVAAPLEVTP